MPASDSEDRTFGQCREQLQRLGAGQRVAAGFQPRRPDANADFPGQQRDDAALRDRLQRNLEFCEIDLNSDKVTPLITEAITDGSLEVQPVRYVKPGGDMIWWSERSGWGHFYVYSNDGKLKNALTEWDRVVAAGGEVMPAAKLAILREWADSMRSKAEAVIREEEDAK